MPLRDRGHREASSTSTPVGASTTFNEAQLLSTPELVQQDVTQPQSSPNNSPASIPTETSAPKPNHVSAPRGRPSATLSRFKPKAVRKSLAERERAEKEEQERRERERRAAERRNGRGGRGDISGRGGRSGRGDAAMGSLNRHFLGLDVASGPFGAGPVITRRYQGKSITPGNLKNEGLSGRSAPTSGNSVTKSTLAHSGSTSEINPDLSLISHLIGDGAGGNMSYMEPSKIKHDFSEPIYPEDQEKNVKATPRVNIDLINLISDDEDGDEEFGNKGKGKAVSRGLRPIRIQREPQKEWATKIKSQGPADPLLKSSILETDVGGQDDSMFVPEIMDDDLNRIAQREYVREGRISSGSWQDDDFGIKYDPDGADSGRPLEEMMDVDVHTRDLPASSIGTNGNVASSKHPSGTIFTEFAGKQRDTSKMSTNAGKKKSQPTFHTPEAKAEYMRDIEDAQILLQELGGSKGTFGCEAAAGNINTDGKVFVEDKEGRVYLFQIPPTIPTLVNPAMQRDVSKGVRTVETEESPPAPMEAEIMDLTKPDEEEVVMKIESEQGPLGLPDANPPFALEEGYVGRLIVRASGRVEMDWGDNDVEREDEEDTDDDEDEGDEGEDEDADEEDEEDGSDESIVLDRGGEGAELLVKRGIQVHFLQTAVIIGGDGEEGDLEMVGAGGSQTESIGKPEATGLGRIMGKFVTIPDFEGVL